MVQSKPVILEGQYEVEKVVWDFCDGTYLVRWKGYTHTGDTREPEAHIPSGKLVAYRKSLVVDGIDVQHPVYLVLESLARQLTSPKKVERDPVYQKVLEIEGLTNQQLAMATLKYLSKLLGIKLTKEGNTTALLAADLDKIAELALLHASRPEQGHGALRTKCGGASYECMLLVWSLRIEYVDGATFGGKHFKVIMSTVGFNGKTGEPRWPAIPDGTDVHGKNYDPAKDERLSRLEQEAIVAHAKAELRQPWATHVARHPLRKAGWHALPVGTWALKLAVAMPGHKRKRG